MEAKMIANSVPVRPEIPSILIDATVKVIQAGMRPEERSTEKSFVVSQDSQTGISTGGTGGARSLKKKTGNKDDDRLRKLVEKRHGAEQEDEENIRTYRNFDERRMGFLVIGDQHRFVGSGGQEKFIFPSAPPLDYSFCMINKIEEIVTENEQPQTNKRNFRSPKKTPDDRYKTSSVRLSYNVIDTVEGLINVLYKILDGGPFGLSWLDLSFNAITKLDDDVISLLFDKQRTVDLFTFSQLPNLKILYIHGNAITDMTEVAILQQLKQLVSLTLHGNPLEEEKFYRISVLYYLPCLKHLDFVAVTKADKANSKEFGAKYEPFWEERHDQIEAIYVTKKRAGEITYTERVMQSYDDDGDDGLDREI